MPKSQRNLNRCSSLRLPPENEPIKLSLLARLRRKLFTSNHGKYNLSAQEVMNNIDEKKMRSPDHQRAEVADNLRASWAVGDDLEDVINQNILADGPTAKMCQGDQLDNNVKMYGANRATGIHDDNDTFIHFERQPVFDRKATKKKSIFQRMRFKDKLSNGSVRRRTSQSDYKETVVIIGNKPILESEVMLGESVINGLMTESVDNLELHCNSTGGLSEQFSTSTESFNTLNSPNILTDLDLFNTYVIDDKSAIDLDDEVVSEKKSENASMNDLLDDIDPYATTQTLTAMSGNTDVQAKTPTQNNSFNKSKVTFSNSFVSDEGGYESLDQVIQEMSEMDEKFNSGTQMTNNNNTNKEIAIINNIGSNVHKPECRFSTLDSNSSDILNKVCDCLSDTKTIVEEDIYANHMMAQRKLEQSWHLCSSDHDSDVTNLNDSTNVFALESEMSRSLLGSYMSALYRDKVPPPPLPARNYSMSDLENEGGERRRSFRQRQVESCYRASNSSNRDSGLQMADLKPITASTNGADKLTHVVGTATEDKRKPAELCSNLFEDGYSSVNKSLAWLSDESCQNTAISDDELLQSSICVISDENPLTKDVNVSSNDITEDIPISQTLSNNTNFYSQTSSQTISSEASLMTCSSDETGSSSDNHISNDISREHSRDEIVNSAITNCDNQEPVHCSLRDIINASDPNDDFFRINQTIDVSSCPTHSVQSTALSGESSDNCDEVAPTDELPCTCEPIHMSIAELQIVESRPYSRVMCHHEMYSEPNETDTDNIHSPTNLIQNTSNSACQNGTEEVYHVYRDGMKQLKDCGWYWGPLSIAEAELKLCNKPDGAFLVRDSHNENYILSLSFRSQSMTHHMRIEHNKGNFAFWSQPESHGRSTIKEFIDQVMENSRTDHFRYFLRAKIPGSPPVPIHLLYPVSRFFRIPSLQHLSRFIILENVRRDHIKDLPLPSKVLGYLNESQYYVERIEKDDNDVVLPESD